MKATLFVALYHASIMRALHVPLPINEVKEINTVLEQASISEENMIGSDGEKSGILGGDINLDDKQFNFLHYMDKNDINDEPDFVYLWPTTEIPYVVVSEHFNYDQLQAIEDAFQEINRISCLNFQQIIEDNSENAVIITGVGGGCYSHIGYLNITSQIINLSNTYDVGNGCFRHGSIMHEILHTLGFHHTQARFDRDEYIDILWNNIKEDKLYGFQKQIWPKGIDLVTSYDYNSCMHYSRKAFSRTGEDTIVPKKAVANIGQREGLSQGDIEMLNLLYCI